MVFASLIRLMGMHAQQRGRELLHELESGLEFVALRGRRKEKVTDGESMCMPQVVQEIIGLRAREARRDVEL